MPPTERATHYHSLRVHLEMMRVTRLDIDCGLDPRDWGWQTVDGVLRPIKTDLPPAPDFLLTVIRCNCKTTSRNTCGTMMCNCRKSGLKCVTAWETAGAIRAKMQMRMTCYMNMPMKNIQISLKIYLTYEIIDSALYWLIFDVADS